MYQCSNCGSNLIGFIECVAENLPLSSVNPFKTHSAERFCHLLCMESWVSKQTDRDIELEPVK